MRTVKQYTLELNDADVLRLAKLLRHDIRKTEREVARSTYVPPPGKRHAGQVDLEKQLALLDKLEEVLGVEIQVWEDEVRE